MVTTDITTITTVFTAVGGLVVHSLNTEYFHFEGNLLGRAARLMATPATPDKGMLMGIPVGGGRLDRRGYFLPGLKALPFEGQGA